MRPGLIALALAALAATGLAAEGAPPAVLEIHNDTGVGLDEVVVAPAGRGPRTNRLEARLEPDQWIELALDPAHGCRYDVTLRTADGEDRAALGVDICADGRIDLSITRRRMGFPDGGPVFAAPGRGLPICPGDPRCKKKK